MPGPRWRVSRPCAGAAAQTTITTADGGSALLIDESYNASPPAVRAALSTCWSAATPAERRDRGAGRHAGARRNRARRRMPASRTRSSAAELDRDLPLRVRHAAMLRALRSERVGSPDEPRLPTRLPVRLSETVRHGDVVLVKGSLGIGMKRHRIGARSRRHGRSAPFAPEGADYMLYNLLAPLRRRVPASSTCSAT
ncbi:MAG: hypothetical protein ACMVO3_22100 [Thalassobaculum sp.]